MNQSSFSGAFPVSLREGTGLLLLPGWWFQPIWKIFVKLGIFPQIFGVIIKNVWVATDPAKVESKKITLNKSGWWFQPIFWGVKPSFFMALGSRGCCYHPFYQWVFFNKNQTKKLQSSPLPCWSQPVGRWRGPWGILVLFNIVWLGIRGTKRKETYII